MSIVNSGNSDGSAGDGYGAANPDIIYYLCDYSIHILFSLNEQVL